QGDGVVRLRIDHAVDVLTDERQRGDARGRCGRREDRQRDRRAAVLPRLGELRGEAAKRDAPVLGLYHQAKIDTSGAGRVDDHYEIALLGPQRVARLGARPLEKVARAPGQLPEPGFQDVFEVGALGGALG